MEAYRSRVYTDRPQYADYDAPQKFQAITGIIGRRLREHPNAVCSYSGGSDSDVLLDLLERAREMFRLQPIDYVFFNTGLEMRATKEHIKAVEEKYHIHIREVKPKMNIVLSTRKYGIPFVSKIMSSAMECVQAKQLPFSIKEEYDEAEDKGAKRQELRERYPNAEQGINFLCCCNGAGEPRPNIQLVINSSPFMYDFMKENPPQFRMSAKCCDYCKKRPAHEVQSAYDLIITGERRDEGGMRSVPRSADANGTMCFHEESSGQFRFKPLYYVSDKDKEWYKRTYGLRYSDAYEVYGMKRTGCCGCPISYRAVDDLNLIEPHEPNIVKAAWNIFGKSYEYREQYKQYLADRRRAEKYAGMTSLF